MPTRPPGTPDVDLTETGGFGFIDEVIFATGQTQPAGTGAFNAFVQIQHNGTEEGYNTDAGAQFDEKSSSQHNHSVLLAEVPIFIGDGANGTIEGRVYREFLLDINEPNGGSKPYISLDALQIWQEEAGDLTSFTAGAGFAGAHPNYLAFDLDAGGDTWIALNDGLSHGSGASDVRILIPDSYFINDATHRYVTLYSAFGEQSGWDADGGFEEWGLRGASGGRVSAIALSKSASVPGGTADFAGEIISYSFQLSNTGNTALSGVTLTDPLTSGVVRGADIIGNNDNTLDAGEMWSFTAQHVVTQNEIDSGASNEAEIVNTATADTDQTGPVTATAVIAVTQSPHVTLVKQATVPGGTADTVGELISYTIAVTNDGNMTLTSPLVTDPAASDLAPVTDPGSPILTPVTSGGMIVGDTNDNGIEDFGEVWTFVNIGDVDQNGVLDAGETFQFHNVGDLDEDGRLSVGETWEYTASHAVTQADIDNGGIVDPFLTYANTANVDTVQGASDDDTASVPVEQRPHVLLSKIASVPGGTADLGELISYAIAVTNDGNMTLTNPVVSDPFVSNLIAQMSGGFNFGDLDLDGNLGVGETWQYTADHVVTAAEIAAGGSINNTASVATAQGAGATGSASVAVTLPPAIGLEKTSLFVDSNENGVANTGGDLIQYVFVVTNLGGVGLTNVALIDPMLGGAIAGPDSPDLNGILDVGESWVYSKNYFLTAADVALPSISNDATVTALDPMSLIVSDAAHLVTFLP